MDLTPYVWVLFQTGSYSIMFDVRWKLFFDCTIAALTWIWSYKGSANYIVFVKEFFMVLLMSGSSSKHCATWFLLQLRGLAFDFGKWLISSILLDLTQQYCGKYFCLYIKISRKSVSVLTRRICTMIRLILMISLEFSLPKLVCMESSVSLIVEVMAGSWEVPFLEERNKDRHSCWGRRGRGL